MPGGAPFAELTRLGRRDSTQTRPLRVSFSSKVEVLNILRNKSRYSGPGKITQDKTPKQKKHFKDLQAQLKIMKDAGDMNKTIRYKNVPKIVNTRRGAVTKRLS